MNMADIIRKAIREARVTQEPVSVTLPRILKSVKDSGIRVIDVGGSGNEVHSPQ